MKSIPADDAYALRWCGVLGHTFVVLRTVTDKDGTVARCTGLETCDKTRAIRAAKTEYASAAPAVYQQVSLGKWKRVVFRMPKQVAP